MSQLANVSAVIISAEEKKRGITPEAVAAQNAGQSTQQQMGTRGVSVQMMGGEVSAPISGTEAMARQRAGATVPAVPAAMPQAVPGAHPPAVPPAPELIEVEGEDALELAQIVGQDVIGVYAEIAEGVELPADMERPSGTYALSQVRMLLSAAEHAESQGAEGKVDSLLDRIFLRVDKSLAESVLGGLDSGDAPAEAAAAPAPGNAPGTAAAAVAAYNRAPGMAIQVHTLGEVQLVVPQGVKIMAQDEPDGLQRLIFVPPTGAENEPIE